MPKTPKPSPTVTLLKPDKGYDWRCQRCGHQWRSRTPDAPVPMQCAHCRSAYWNRPRSGKGVKRTVRPKPHMRTRLGIPILDGGPAVDSPLLPPPPHLRNQTYRPPEPEPAPENMITRHGQDSNDNHEVQTEAPDDWSQEHTEETVEEPDETQETES